MDEDNSKDKFLEIEEETCKKVKLSTKKAVDNIVREYSADNSVKEHSADKNKDQQDFEEEIEEIFKSFEEEIADNESHLKESCSHSIVVQGLCAMCGDEIEDVSNFVSVVHNSDKVLQKYEDAYQTNLKHFFSLCKRNKMILLLDLDHTLVHVTLAKAKCDFSFVKDGVSFYAKTRPGLCEFLEEMHELFEMHVFTLGVREYANEICKNIDPDKKYFGDRIISRSENNGELKKSIKRILNIDKNVLVLDDSLATCRFVENVIVIAQFIYYEVDEFSDPTLVAKRKIREEKQNKRNETKNIALEGKKEINDFLAKECEKNDKEISNENASKIKRDYVQMQHKDLNFSCENIKKTFEKDETKKTVKKEDRELYKNIGVFNKIHSEFFSSNKKAIKNSEKCNNLDEFISVCEFSKLNILEGMSFGCSAELANYVIFMGGTVVPIQNLKSIENVYIVENKEMSKKFNVKNVRKEFLLDCLCNRRLEKIDAYFI